jgi:adenosylcobinamide-phosphate synthase
MTNVISLLIGWLLDLVFGDPQRLPHPVVWFGKMISATEHALNKGRHRLMKGAVTAIGLILLVYGAGWVIRHLLHGVGIYAVMVFDVIVIFYCLAGTTLIREVREVFLALDRSLEEGRTQVASIVGRDTTQLSAQEVRQAALETLAENLSDGVIAPLFFLALLGTPGMLAYKMVNTLDSMIGYRTRRYRDFGCWAARIDDAANYIPARLTALLMLASHHLLTIVMRDGGKCFTLCPSLFTFVCRNGRKHASPNSGYPEAALAGILNCRFGGPHYYFGELFDKPFIGDNERALTTADMQKATRINRMAEVLMVGLVALRFLCL